MKNIKGIYLGYAENLEPQSRAFEEVGGELIKGSLGEVPSTDSARSLLSPKDGSNDKINKVVSLIEETKAQSLVLQGHGFPLNNAFFDAVGKIDGFKGIACFGHGFDGIDVDSATENGIIVANAASFGTEEVSNHALMHLLVCARKFVLHDKLVKNGEWTREHLPPMGHISGQTLGIVGIGNIGRAMGRKAKGLGMNVIAFDPNVSSWDFKEYGIEFVSSINELCERSDYVSLHCPLLESTRKIMSTEQFKLMKKTAYLINCSRGPVVDEKALIEALNNNEIAGAGLDVFEEEPTYPENPLLKMDNVGVTNHYASYSEVAWERAETQLGEEAVRISTDSYPMSLVNPGVKSKLTGKKEPQGWEIYRESIK